MTQQNEVGEARPECVFKHGIDPLPEGDWTDEEAKELEQALSTPPVSRPLDPDAALALTSGAAEWVFNHDSVTQLAFAVMARVNPARPKDGGKAVGGYELVLDGGWLIRIGLLRAEA